MNSTLLHSLSVEQIYLITKLRHSGVTKDQVIEAWNTMDKVDKVDLEIHRPRPTREPYTMPNLVPPKGISAKFGSLAPDLIIAEQNSNFHSNITDTSQSSHESESEFCQQLSPSLVLDTMDTRDPETVFLEYKSRPELEVVDEIKTFVMIHNIKQQRIADMSGISQGYISKFFRGEGSEMSDRSKSQIIRWYLKYRDFPEKIFEFVPKDKEVVPITPRAITYGTPSTALLKTPSLTVTPINVPPVKSQSLLPGSRLLPNVSSQSRFTYPSGVLSSPYLGGSLRRQRFIFRKQQIEILEKHFKQNEYPDQFTKQQIVDELNSITDDPHGRPLSERDKVSYPVVSTWFNNKRKERSKTNPQASPSRGKGRPPRSEYCQSGDESRSQEEISNKRRRSASPTEPDEIVSNLDFEDLVFDGDHAHVKIEGSHNNVPFDDNHGLVDDVAVFDYDDTDYERFMHPRPDLTFKDCSKTYSRNTQQPTISSDAQHSDVNQPD